MDKEGIYFGIVAFMDDDSAATNERYIIELCQLALHQYIFSGLDIVEMKNVIKEIVPFDYTEEELISVLEDCRNNQFEKKDEKWFLSSDAEREINNREKEFGLRKYVDQYCDAFLSEEDVNRNDLCELLSKFIYDKFKESVDQISGIIDAENKIELYYSDDYTEEDKLFINNFLSWDNDEKNQMVYRLIVRSYDFCVINCNKQPFLDFSSFTFYLDANVLMRYMGINNRQRKESVERFIEKCKSVNIKLCVSSFSKKEIQKSLDNQISSIQTMIEDSGRIMDVDAAKCCIEAYSFSIELYKMYYGYVKKKRDNSFNGFKQYIFRKLDEVIRQFEFDEKISFELMENEKFKKYYELLKEIKDEKIVKTDVNNILLVDSLRNTNKDTYMISADNKLINWCKDMYVGQTSLIEYPSVWLSIITKYTGRVNEDDYSAFCKFIRLPLMDKDKDIKAKLELKKNIDAMGIADYLKDRMLVELSSNFQHYQEFMTVDEKTKKLYEAVQKEKEESIRKEEQEKYQVLLFEKEINNKKDKKEFENVIKQKADEYEKNLKKVNEDTVEFKIAKFVDEKVANNKKRAEWLKFHKSRILFVVAIFLVISVAVSYFLTKNKIKWNDAIWGLVLTGIAFVIEWIVKTFLDSLIETWGNEEENRKKYNKRIRKKYRKLL